MDVLYLVAQLVAIFGALMTVSRRNPVYSAGWMMVTLTAVAAVFAVLHASFLSVIQVLLYAGAIVVLFVFVIMLLNPTRDELARERTSVAQVVIGVLMSSLLFAVLVSVFVRADPALTVPFGASQIDPSFGTTEYFGRTIYDNYLVAFELISFVVFAAIAAVVLVGKRDLLAKPAAPQEAESSHG